MSDPADWLDSKRLIGRHCFGDEPGALLEVAGSDETLTARIDRFRTIVAELGAQLGWPKVAVTVARHDGGAMLVATAPEDRLYAATEVLEAAWTASATAGGSVDEAERERLQAFADDECDPRGLALVQAARERGIPAHLDESGTQVGLGRRGRHWPPGGAPELEDLNWEGLGTIPLALVTGTNGKTTTTRLLTAMAREAGRRAGYASTDGATIGDSATGIRVLDAGDLAGPGGARRVLRENDLDLAILETARGGLLRRGLAVDHADVAVVTNISADHLGDGGVDSLERLADVKFLVTRALDDRGVAVLNRDDAFCRQRGGTLPCPVHWFSLAPPPADESGAWAWFDGGVLRLRDRDGSVHELGTAEEFPITLGGHARYNVANALAASLAARVLEIPVEAIRRTLQSFGAADEDNAGRGLLRTIDGVRVVVDFGHNPAGVRAVLDMFPATDRGHLHVTLGQAGDRSDTAIRDLVNAAVDGGADRFVVKEMGEYRRGREPGEVPDLIEATLAARGVSGGQIDRVVTELEAAERALDNATAGDVIVLFIQTEFDAVLAALEARARPESQR